MSYRCRIRCELCRNDIVSTGNFSLGVTVINMNVDSSRHSSCPGRGKQHLALVAVYQRASHHTVRSFSLLRGSNRGRSLGGERHTLSVYINDLYKLFFSIGARYWKFDQPCGDVTLETIKRPLDHSFKP
jgi:hypothetical protein